MGHHDGCSQHDEVVEIREPRTDALCDARTDKAGGRQGRLLEPQRTMCSCKLLKGLRTVRTVRVGRSRLSPGRWRMREVRLAGLSRSCAAKSNPGNRLCGTDCSEIVGFGGKVFKLADADPASVDAGRGESMGGGKGGCTEGGRRSDSKNGGVRRR
eukprot:979299-Rhodomonas_salina.1